MGFVTFGGIRRCQKKDYESDVVIGRYPYGHLFAILFLIFDVEAMFMFPWAVIVREVGVAGLVNILFFMVILVLGLAYAWKKGALEWK